MCVCVCVFEVRGRVGEDLLVSSPPNRKLWLKMVASISENNQNVYSALESFVLFLCLCWVLVAVTPPFLVTLWAGSKGHDCQNEGLTQRALISSH